MDTFGASLGIAGLLVPFLLLALSALIVYRLAVKLQKTGSSPSTRPWLLVLLHVGIVAGVDVGFEPLTRAAGVWRLPPPVVPVIPALGFLIRLLSLVAVPAVLARRLRSLTRKRGSASPAAAERETTPATLERRSGTRIAWFMGVSGVLLPWIVGLGVKVYLQSVNRPTHPLSDFLTPSFPGILAASAIQWSFPFLAWALFTRFRLLNGRENRFSRGARRRMAWIVYGAGVAAAVVLFTGVFWEFDIMYLFVPLGIFLVPPMALAYGAVRLVLRRRTRPPGKPAAPAPGTPASP